MKSSRPLAINRLKSARLIARHRTRDPRSLRLISRTCCHTHDQGTKRVLYYTETSLSRILELQATLQHLAESSKRRKLSKGLQYESTHAVPRNPDPSTHLQDCRHLPLDWASKGSRPRSPSILLALSRHRRAMDQKRGGITRLQQASCARKLHTNSRLRNTPSRLQPVRPLTPPQPQISPPITLAPCLRLRLPPSKEGFPLAPPPSHQSITLRRCVWARVALSIPSSLGPSSAVTELVSPRARAHAPHSRSLSRPSILYLEARGHHRNGGRERFATPARCRVEPTDASVA